MAQFSGGTSLAQKTRALPPKDELVEFVNEALAARVGDARAYGNALLTVLESAHGTEFFADAKAICFLALDEKLVEQDELRQLLAQLR